MTPKYQIGDVVWRPTFETRENSMECPDCGGTGRLRVTFHDETTVSIGCQNCSRGYDNPSGRVTYYDRVAEAHQGVISGIEMDTDGVTYHLRQSEHSSWHLSEFEVFSSYDEAFAHAVVLAKKATTDELQRIFKKEKDTRTWAWNASYHRKAVKEAERNLEYHTKKLAAANLKAKAEKKEK